MPHDDSAERRPNDPERARQAEQVLDSLTELVESHATEKMSIATKVHEGEILVVTRSHTSEFRIGGDAGEHDELNAAIRAQLSPMVRLLDMKYGSLGVELEQRKIKSVVSVCSFTRGELVGWLRRLWKLSRRERGPRGSDARQGRFRVLGGRR